MGKNTILSLALFSATFAVAAGCGEKRVSVTPAKEASGADIDKQMEAIKLTPGAPGGAGPGQGSGIKKGGEAKPNEVRVQ